MGFFSIPLAGCSPTESVRWYRLDLTEHGEIEVGISCSFTLPSLYSFREQKMNMNTPLLPSLSCPVDPLNNNFFKSFPTNIQPLSSLYEMRQAVHSYNAVDLNWKMPQYKEVFLYTQEIEYNDEVLDKWLVKPSHKGEESNARFSMKRFGWFFLGESQFRVHDPKNPSQNFDMMFPGLNYVAFCGNGGCEFSKRPFLLSMGSEKVSLYEEIFQQRIRCPRCGYAINDQRMIDKLIIFQASGAITFKEPHLRKPITTRFNVTGNNFLIFDELGQKKRKFEFFFLKIKKQPFNVKVKDKKSIQYDVHKNPKGDQFDLAPNQAFKGVKVLIGKFHTEDGFYMNDFKRQPGAALSEKGFDWKCTEDESEFLKLIDDYDIIWVISFNWHKPKNHDFVDRVVEAYRSGNIIFNFFLIH